MPEPNDMPRIVLPPAPQPNEGAMNAQLALNQARASQDAEQAVTKFIDVMRKVGSSWEEIAKHGEDLHATEMKVLKMRKGETEAWKALAPEMNMSIEAIKKMPLRDLGKNFEGVAASLSKMAMPLMSVGTAVTAAATAFKTIIDSLGGMNTAAGRFAISRGDIAGAIDPSYNDRKAANLAKGSLTSAMGFSGDQFAAVQGALARQVQMKGSQAYNPTVASGAIAKLTGEDPAVVAQRMGAAMRSGSDDFVKTMASIIKDADKFGTSTAESAAQIQDLYMASRALGAGLGDAKATVQRFSAELNKGIMVASDMQNMDPKRRQFQQIAQAIAMGKASGVEVKGVTDQPDMLKAVGHVLGMGQKEGLEAMLKLTSGGVQGFAKAGGGGDPEREMALRKLLLQTMSTGSSGMDLAITQGIKTGGVPRIKGPDAGLVDELAKQAASVSGAQAGFTDGVGSVLKGLGTLTDAFVAAAADFDKRSKTPSRMQDANYVRPLYDPMEK